MKCLNQDNKEDKQFLDEDEFDIMETGLRMMG